MWSASTSPQIDEFAPGEELPACLYQHSKFGLLQRWLNLSNPFAAFGISVLGIYILLGVFLSRFDILQAVRFLPDTFDLVDLYVPSLQQSWPRQRGDDCPE